MKYAILIAALVLPGCDVGETDAAEVFYPDVPDAEAPVDAAHASDQKDAGAP